MRYSIVYTSLTGNGKILADKIHSLINDDECIYFGKPNDDALNADIIFIGFWTNLSMVDDTTKSFLAKLSNQKIFLFGTAGFGISEDYFKLVITNSLPFIPKSVTLLDSFVCQGKMGMHVREKYLRKREETKEYEKFDRMIKNFDLALSHPDAKDLKNLEIKVKKIFANQ